MCVCVCVYMYILATLFLMLERFSRSYLLILSDSPSLFIFLYKNELLFRDNLTLANFDRNGCLMFVAFVRTLIVDYTKNTQIYNIYVKLYNTSCNYINHNYIDYINAGIDSHISVRH